MKFNQLVDDAAENLEVALAVNFADLAKQAQLKAQFSQLRTEYNDYFNKLFINGKEFTLPRIDWRDLINGNYLKESLIGIFGYPWYVIKELAIIWTVINFLQCLFGLFRSAITPHSVGTGTQSTQASLQDANTCPLHDGANLPTATVFGHR